MRGRRTSLRMVLTPGGTERTGATASLHDDPFRFGSTITRVILGVADGLALVDVARLVGMTEKHVAQVDHAVLEKSPRRVTRSPRTRPQAVLDRGRDARGEDRLRTA